VAVDPETIGEFIDAIALDPTKALQMLQREPRLREARWRLQETILHFVCIEGDAAQVRLLGEWGFDPNAPNEFGDSPLIDVATLGRDDIAEILLDLGADPNARSALRDNVLHCAVRSGNARLVNVLLTRGAKGDYVTDLEETAYDVLPRDRANRAEIEAILQKHNVRRPNDRATEAG
jgi:ankyrin repeat protein